MEQNDLRSTSYHSGFPATRRSELSPSDHVGHRYGNLYVADNAVVHLGDSQSGSLLEESSRLRLSAEKERKADLQRLKNGLDYPSINDRKAQIDSVDANSVEWIWNTTFQSWLGTDEAFFWIAGKPGSGKSTLMKFLATSGETVQMLSKEANRCIILHFYFDFTVGSGLSNSKKGLLRSLLFQLVSQVPHIGDLINDRHGHALSGSWLELEAELLNTLCDVLKSSETKCCIFIDGVDEYSGKPRDLILTLRELQRRTQMKICLAGRPDKAVARMLTAYPSIYVQDHNGATIQSCIEAACQELEPEEIEATRPLWQHVEHEANGVILWARYVVDEIRDQILVGATTRELQDVLQKFPSEMEGVYARVLQELPTEQQLHAAIAFYAIEHGLTRFASSQEFSTYEFFVTWTTMVENLDHNARFDQSFDTRQFKVRIEAMLGGLLEFSQTESVRFVHTTLESYLREANVFKMIVKDNISPLYGDGLAGHLFLQTIRQAIKEVIFDLNRVDFQSVGEVYDSTFDMDKLVEQLKVRDGRSHFSHRIPFLLTAVERLGQALSDSSTQASLVWDAIKSPIFELHPLLCKDNSCGCSTDFRTKNDFWHDRWCLRFLASHGLYSAFEHGIHETTYSRPYALPDLLEVTIEIVQKAQLELEAANSLADMSQPQRSSFALDGHRFIDLLLEGQPLEPQHLAICQIINFPKEPRFATRLRQIQQPTSYRILLKCPWFNYDSCNLLCSWVWCSDMCYDRSVQVARLNSLLEIGFNVNVRAYSGGTALHALFDYREPVPCSSHVRLHHITWPFSRVKFNLIREAGFDFTTPMVDNILDHARAFRAGIQQRTKWQKLRTAEIESIRDLDAFIKDVLEPLCRPWSPRLRPETPPSRPQSPSWNHIQNTPKRAATIQLASGRSTTSSRISEIQAYGPFVLQSGDSRGVTPVSSHTPFAVASR